MKRLFPIIGVALLIFLLVLVNRGISHTAQPDTDDDDASPSSSQTAHKPAAPPPSTGLLGQTAELAPEITVGDPAKAKHKVTVGWNYDEASLAHPQALAAALQAVQQTAQSSHGVTSAEIVDLDVPTTELSPLAADVHSIGIFVDGVPIGPTRNPGEPGQTADVIARSLPR